ncbi:MAG: HNH endonuclease signature motif containing protein, partial [Nitrososphaerales archaeon]
MSNATTTIPETSPAADLSTAEDLMAARDLIKRFVATFEPGLFSGEDSKTLVRLFSEVKHLASSGILLAARRVEQTHTHEQDGHKRAGSWLATVTGESVGQAAGLLEAARSIEAHPEISEAFRSGKLSEAKAKEIASAADACPAEAANLVEAAETMELGALKRHCADTRSVRTSEDDEAVYYEKMRQRRYCRIWKDPDGSGRLDARVTPDALAVLLSCIEPFEKQVFNEARRAGRIEPQHAYMADALVYMAKAAIGGSGKESSGSETNSRDPQTLVRIRVDLPALKRGHREPGECCEIPGIGSVPVKAVREILGDSLLELVLTHGTDVTTVCSDSRYITRALRIALEERDQTCCVPGCEMSDPLEIDHYRTDYAKDGKTSLDNLARLCAYHHHQKTYRGWRLEGGPGNWRFVGPDPPDQPNPPDEPDPPDEPEPTDRSGHRQKRDPSKKTDAPRNPASTADPANQRAGVADRSSRGISRQSGAAANSRVRTKRATG